MGCSGKAAKRLPIHSSLHISEMMLPAFVVLLMIFRDTMRSALLMWQHLLQRQCWGALRSMIFRGVSCRSRVHLNTELPVCRIHGHPDC